MPTLVIVAPKPLPKLVTALSGARPAPMPTPRAPITSAMNGCTLSQVMSAMITTMPTRAAMISCGIGPDGSTVSVPPPSAARTAPTGCASAWTGA